MVNGGAKALLLTKEGWQPPRLTGWFSFSNCVHCGSTKEKRKGRKAKPRKDRKDFRSQISNFKFQIFDVRNLKCQILDLKGIRFVNWRLSSFANSAPPLRSLRLRSCLKTQRPRCESRKDRGREIIAQGKAESAATLGNSAPNHIGACEACDRGICRRPSRLHEN